MFDQSAKPRILVIVPSMLPSAMIYSIKPLKELEKRQLVDIEYNFESRVTAEQVRSKDLIIFVRNDSVRYNFILEEARGHGISTIYDVDDNLWELPKDNPSKGYHLDDRIRQMEHYMRSVDLVKVYNPIVFDKVKAQFNRHAYLGLAGIDTHLAPDQRLPKQDSKLRIAYATSRGVGDELYQLIIPDLKRLLDEYPDQVELILWRGLPEGLKGHLNVNVQPLERDYESFIRSLASSGYDIGLAPLLSDVFYQSKTNTKFRDYGLSRIAGIYSDNSVYEEVQDGVTGLKVPQEPGAWYRAIVRLIQDETLRISIQDAAYRYVVDHYRQELMEAEWVQLLERLGCRRVGSGQKLTSEPSSIAMNPIQKRSAKLLAGQNGVVGEFILECSDRPGEKITVKPGQPLPLETGSVDLFDAIESLETAVDLPWLLSEIFRVCKHGARLSVFARYGSQQLNQANPQVRQVFNEHTPRFWTTSPYSRVYVKEYANGDHEHWGLLRAENAPFDFRCMRMEFFYRPEYREETIEEKRKVRKKFINVCDLMLCSFLVIKHPVSEEEMDELEQQFDYSDPPEVTIRRYQEYTESLQEQIGKLQAMMRQKQTEVDRWKNMPFILKSRELLYEYNSMKQNRWVNYLLRLTYRPDALPKLAPAFAPLVAATRAVHPDLKGFRVQPGLNLQFVNYLAYPVTFTKPNLQEISLGLVFDLPLSQGTVGIELVNPQNRIVAQTSLPFNEINEYQPVSFQFPAISDTTRGLFELRVIGKNLDAPVHVYEFQKYKLFGLGKLMRILIAEFHYS